MCEAVFCISGYDLESKFKLTGETGSYRYMAPEVFRHEPYNFKVPSGSALPVGREPRISQLDTLLPCPHCRSQSPWSCSL
jgi:hypothetical protein